MAAYPPAEPKQAHPLNLAFAMALVAFAFNVAMRAVGVDMEHGLGYSAAGALIAAATAALAGYGNKALVAFVGVGCLAGWSVWWALFPATVIVVFRVGRRAVRLSQASKSTPRRGPRRGFWPTLQAWAGWSRR